MTEIGSMIFQIMSIISICFLLLLEFFKKGLSKRCLISFKLAALLIIFIYVSNV
ncbi:TPA: hypothetical protein ACOTG0_002047 [Clostridium perfringens]|nr:hypothetical protein phiCPD_00051 [Clostridium phage phiCp-D]